MKKLFFFLGKGGVGKTTLAASFASYLSGKGARVFLASIDPAHNLFDFFGTKPSKGQLKITENLTLEEFDIEQYLRTFLRDSSKKMKDTYRYLQMINLENMFDVLKHSPGMEEYAMLSALHDLLDKWRDKVDYIVIDTPPTGLMLRIFSLPRATVMWIEKLKDLRTKILARRSQITHIKGRDALGKGISCESDSDVIFQQLTTQEKLAREIWQILNDDEICRKILVLNYDELSVREGIKITRDLDSLGIRINLAVFNKRGMSDVPGDKIKDLFSQMQAVKKVQVPFYRQRFTPRDKMDEIAQIFAGELL